MESIGVVFYDYQFIMIQKDRILRYFIWSERKNIENQIKRKSKLKQKK